MNKFHVYQTRHVFAGDDHIGKWEVAAQTVRLREEFAGLADQVKAYFMQTHGIPMKVLVGQEEFQHAAPLLEFPDEIRGKMLPTLGDLTPEVVEFARRNFTPAEFERRYRGRAEFVSDPEEIPAAEQDPGHPELGDEAPEFNGPEVVEKKKPGRKPKHQD